MQRTYLPEWFSYNSIIAFMTTNAVEQRQPAVDKGKYSESLL